MESFREIVKREMQRRGWTAYRLAAEIKLPERNVSYFLSGATDTTTARLEAMCRVLDLELKPTAEGPKKRIAATLTNAKRPGDVSRRGKIKKAR